jgi:hypothetical protein
MGKPMNDDQEQLPESLLPYAEWAEEALRQVAVRALSHAAEHGLPGDHHFYLTFRTDLPGVDIPPRLLAQYPQEMTIVLQHQFWDLKVEPDHFSVGLAFGGVPGKLVVPFAALTSFADPQVRFGLRFRPIGEVPELQPPPEPEPPPPPPPPAEEKPQVVSLDAFRRRPKD